MNPLRKKKLETSILREWSLLLQKLQNKDERLSFVNVHKVDLASDFSMLRIYISFFGDDRSRKEGLIVIQENLPLLQSQLSRNLRLRSTPKIFLKVLSEEQIQKEIYEASLLENT